MTQLIVRCDQSDVIVWKYCKSPKISPGAFGGAYIRRGLSTEGNLRFKINWASLIAGSKFPVLLCIWGQFSKCNPQGGLYLEGRFNGGFLEGLIHGGAYFGYFTVSLTEVGIKLEVNWLWLCDLTHFLRWKQSKIRWNVCFNFTLLIIKRVKLKQTSKLLGSKS